jgi:Ca2+-binding EF-hand superfamily protein
MRMLRRYDLDGDCVISRQEFAEGTLRRFNRLDANGDGAITEEEIATVRRRWAR